MTSSDDNEQSLGSREFTTTRLIAAPQERVFRAFSNPALLAQWWGPNGFTNTFHEFDLQPGGAWRVVMHGPDGTDYINESVFVDVLAPERIVFRHERTMHRFQMTMNFDREGNKTRLTWRMLFDSAEEADRVRGFVPAANEQNFDRLEALLAATADS